MKNRFLVSLTTLMLTALIFTGCTQLPQTEIDAANAAIEEARVAGAEIYLHESFVSLQDSLNVVMLNMESEQSKFMKNYTIVKEQLAGVVQYAQEVKLSAEVRKEEMNAEVLKAISEVQELVAANRQLILDAPKGKEGTSALDAISGELAAVEVAVDEVNTAVEAADFMAAFDKIFAAKEKAASINTELTEVISKYKASASNKKR